jgi:hypothetical protein
VVPWGGTNDIHGFAQNALLRNRNAFVITDTELMLIAALAIIGLNNNPSHGYPIRVYPDETDRMKDENSESRLGSNARGCHT